MDANATDVLDRVGPRLRELRLARGLQLTATASAAGMSKSTLSRLESGQRRATLELLLPLARIYAVTLDELVDAPPTGDPLTTLRPVDRHGRTFVPLTSPTGGIEAFKVIIPVSTAADEPDPRTHQGFQWLLVVRGRLRVILGEHDFELGPGEVAEFSTRVPHWFGTIGDEPAECIALAGRQGERVRMRARPRP